MNKEETIKKWLNQTNEYSIDDTKQINKYSIDNKEKIKFITTYISGFTEHEDLVIEDMFVVKSVHKLNLKDGIIEDITTDPVVDYFDACDIYDSIGESLFTSIKDRVVSPGVIEDISIIKKRDISLTMSYVDIFSVRLIQNDNENEEIRPFEECEAIFRMFRVYSSMPYELRTANCSEAFDVIEKIKEDLDKELNEILANKIENENGALTYKLVDCTNIILNDMYNNLVKLTENK